MEELGKVLVEVREGFGERCAIGGSSASARPEGFLDFEMDDQGPCW
jgi:hypothetical protein